MKRDERRARAKDYLLKAGSIHAAQQLARKERFTAQSAVWIEAWKEIASGK